MIRKHVPEHVLDLIITLLKKYSLENVQKTSFPGNLSIKRRFKLEMKEHARPFLTHQAVEAYHNIHQVVIVNKIFQYSLSPLSSRFMCKLELCLLHVS